MIFEQSAMEAILFFKMWSNFFYTHVVIAIYISCKFGGGYFYN